PYAKVALNLQAQPKIVPLMQATKLIVSPQLAPQLKQPINFGLPKDGIKVGDNNGQNNGQKIGGGLGINLPGKQNDGNGANNGPGNTGINGRKITTLPVNNGGNNANGNTGINGGKIVTLPVNNGGKADASDKKVVTLPSPGAGNGPANTGINGG